MLLPLVGLTAGQFIASAVILSTMLGINYQVAVIIVAVVVTVYSIMGGLDVYKRQLRCSGKGKDGLDCRIYRHGRLY